MKKLKVLLIILLFSIVLLLSGCGNIDTFGDKASNFVKDGITLINDNISSNEQVEPDDNLSPVDAFLSSTLGVTLVEMAIQLVATLIIFLIVRFLIWNKVTEILEARKKMVRDAIDKRDEALNEAKLALEDAKITKKNAEVEASKIVENAKKRGYNEAEQIISNASEKAKLSLSNANEEIERMNNENIASVKKQIVEVAYAMASKIVEKEIKEDKYDLKVEDFYKDKEVK
ncbi:MAG: ATP synthase F0 subunit B [Bacilli bacterium]|nr:ATP synthase F0 subunit B [Bacilli bacterium]